MYRPNYRFYKYAEGEASQQALKDQISEFLSAHWQEIVGMLAGGAVGGAAGYMLSPEGYKGLGTGLGVLGGAGLGGLVPSVIQSLSATSETGKEPTSAPPKTEPVSTKPPKTEPVPEPEATSPENES